MKISNICENMYTFNINYIMSISKKDQQNYNKKNELKDI